MRRARGGVGARPSGRGNGKRGSPGSAGGSAGKLGRAVPFGPPRGESLRCDITRFPWQPPGTSSRSFVTSQRGELPALPGGPGRWGRAGPPAPLHRGRSRGDAGDSGAMRGHPSWTPHCCPMPQGGGSPTAPGPALATTSTCPSPTRLGQRRRCQRCACSPWHWGADLRPGQSPCCHPRDAFSHWGKCHLAAVGPHTRMLFSLPRASALFGVLTQPGWMRINPKPSEQSWFPAWIPSPGAASWRKSIIQAGKLGA